MVQKLQKILAIAVVGLFAFPAISYAADQSYSEMPAGVYELDKTHASFVWKVDHLGLSKYTARFSAFDATLNFDPVAPEQSSVTARIDPNFLRTDYPYPEKENFDEVLSKGAKWFNSVEFPEIVFKSRSVKKMSDNEGVMTGDLTFLGVTKSIDLNVKYNGSFLEKPYTGVTVIGFSAEGTIKRSDFGMDLYIPNIGDVVQIEIEAEFVQPKP